MGGAVRRWLAPATTAVAVLVLLTGSWWLARGSGEPQDRGTAVPPAPSATPVVRGGDDPAPLPGATVSRAAPGPAPLELTGYSADGRELTLTYTIGITRCYGRIYPPQVVETATDVTVTLTRRPVPPGSGHDCPKLSLIEAARVMLAAPLDDRVVRDGARGGALVPAEPPVAGTLAPLAVR